MRIVRYASEGRARRGVVEVDIAGIGVLRNLVTARA